MIMRFDVFLAAYVAVAIAKMAGLLSISWLAIAAIPFIPAIFWAVILVLLCSGFALICAVMAVVLGVIRVAEIVRNA